MNHINDLLSPLHDIVTHKTAGTNKGGKTKCDKLSYST